MSLFAPMKFEHSSRAHLERFIESDEWALEQKLDGSRALVKVRPEGGIEFFTHGGRRLKHTAATQHFPKISRDMEWFRQFNSTETWYLDGEIMIDTGVFWVFDAPYIPFTILPDCPLSERRDILENVLFAMPGPSAMKNVKLAYQAKTVDEKRLLAKRVEESGAEGLMAKRLDGPYLPGKRVTHSLKVKFVRTADCVVMARGKKHSSAQLGSYNAAGDLVTVGYCSMIGKPDAQPGDVVEVKYLYKLGTLMQPRLVKMRPDKEPHECTMDQFETYSKEVLRCT